jgi:hypothetical protein
MRGFTLVHPSDLPLACDTRMGRVSLGFSPGLRTPQLPATHARVGTGLGTLARTHTITNPILLSVRSLTSCDLTSHFPCRVFALAR